MLSLNKILQSVSRQLGGFSRSSKLFLGALMVIMLMSLGFVAIYAGRSEMAPLGLTGAASAEAQTRAANFLGTRGIKWEEIDGDIYVPVEQRHTVWAQLTENELITTDQIDFSKVLEDPHPFIDRETRRKRFLVIKMSVVSRMISELSTIEWAKVLIDQPDRAGGIGSARIDPTAAVSVMAAGGVPLTQTQADSIARLVAGAHAPLKLEKVHVVDAMNGRSFRARTDDDVGGNRYLDMQLAHEKRAKKRILEALSVFPGAVVAVNAIVDARSEISIDDGFEAPKIGVRKESVLERSTTDNAASGEPGVRPNTGANISGAAKATTSTSENRSDTESVNAFPHRQTQQTDPKGHAVQINATVLVPLSYLVRLYQKRSGDQEAQPDQATLDTLAQEIKAEIKRVVEPLIDTTAIANAVQGRVVVSMFADLSGGMGPSGGAAGSGGSATGGSGIVSRGMIETISLSALVVGSLLLMVMMVRHATRIEEMPSAEEIAGIPPSLTESEDVVVGEADEGITAMEGVEVDEDAVRRQQMVEQINELAMSAPDEAASLLRRWIKTDD